MKKLFVGASLLAVGTVSLFAPSASAAGLVSCSSGAVTASGFGDATACAGAFDGNDTGAQGTLLTKLNDEGLFDSFVGDATWSLLGKSDDGSGILTASNGLASGTWSLLTAITQPFVLSLKAGNSYSAYLFDGTTPITSGTFETLGVSVNGRGNAQALSHASIFIADVDDNGSVDVPEPATILALGVVAVGGLGALKKKS